MKEILRIKENALQRIKEAESKEEIEELRIKYLGRKGSITQLLKEVGRLPSSERPSIGKLANEVKAKIQSEISLKLLKLGIEEKERVLEKEMVDVTLPGRRPDVGCFHPLTQTTDEILKIFMGLGFRVVEGPEIETEYYNFEALNMPQDHPSRDTFHTFYIEEDLLLRSHTSPMQIRVMEKEQPPIRIVVPGKVFRPDAVDSSHSYLFHQVEGLMVDEKVTFGDLKGVLTAFVTQIFGKDKEVRFLPDFFPFTEPSAQVHISCTICGGKGCAACKHSGWIEILGAGMVDPEVFKMVGYDPERFSGFAFGMGVERVCMAKFGVNDIRLFLENDLRFLKQF